MLDFKALHAQIFGREGRISQLNILEFLIVLTVAAQQRFRVGQGDERKARLDVFMILYDDLDDCSQKISILMLSNFNKISSS